ncbi:hypothetical protein [Methylobacterium platani]|uniref:Uncharacterized protein n=2 Tax=Methylobacterium platani TaxID=427683 RepID=A0A179S5A0_9HYPH|nr:hypothetical protein [Methylobacterium platani]KMO14100.1 hypothetical protein SQ03_20275 [Methylobacterium platani JCM 14648]OAS22278.1 hypothetical protein A5481_20150 [Methylobacterium platani]
MRALTIRVSAVAAALVLGTAGTALARNSDSGSGLSPYAALNGNDRSAGINNGNYSQPRYDPYLRAYGRPPVRYYERRVPPPYDYGYPY